MRAKGDDMAWKGPMQTTGTIIARLVNERGKEVRRVKIPGYLTFLLNLRDMKYYDRQPYSKTFVVRPLAHQRKWCCPNGW